jgi:hypothetical protein
VCLAPDHRRGELDYEDAQLQLRDIYNYYRELLGTTSEPDEWR